MAGRETSADPGGCQREQPADVIGEHEVPGWTHDVRAQDRAGIEEPVELGIAGPADALAEPPLCTRVVLRLYRSHPAHRVDRRVERLTGEALSTETSGGKIAHTR